MSRPRYLYTSYLVFKGLLLVIASQIDPSCAVGLVPGLLSLAAAAPFALIESQM